jgi:hypothetical protein
MEIQARIARSFLTKEECQETINFFENNIDRTNIWNDTISLALGNEPPLNVAIKIKNQIMQDFNVELNYFHIVKWPVGAQMHKHFDGVHVKDNHCTCICYLNSEYKGGRTFINDKYIDSKAGDYLFFDSKHLLHGVEEIYEGERYTLSSWYKRV